MEAAGTTIEIQGETQTQGQRMAKASSMRKARRRFAWCFRPGEEPAFGTPGFSRVVFANSPSTHRHRGPYKYPTNYISTTKYNPITFLPKALFEQFRRAANIYFLMTAGLSLTPLTPFTPISLIGPLVFVVGVDMIREAVEDWRRFQADREVNSRLVKVHVGEGQFAESKWQDLLVGDVVLVEKDQYFPADLLMLSSSHVDGVCYVETMNLDGETNLKLRKALDSTLSLGGDGKSANAGLAKFNGEIKCEDPNPSLYTFIGNLEWNNDTLVLGPPQILLRDSKLRNTAYVYGVVIFSGFDTKVMKNATDAPSKRSRIEKKMDKIIFFLFFVMFILALITGIAFGVLTKSKTPKFWYLATTRSVTAYYDPNRPALAGLLQFVTSMILYGYLIPISLYVSIAIVKVFQAQFINWDLEMYYEPIDRPAQARTSNLNEELGQVETILSDKTGTLTCNQMDFMKCTIGGVSYGRGVTEIEIAASKRLGRPLPIMPESDGEDSGIVHSGALLLPVNIPMQVMTGKKTKKPKGWNLEDERLTDMNWLKQPNCEDIRQFLRILAVCHTVVPEVDEDTGAVKYEAESPDEAAFVVAARELGCTFFKRTQSGVCVREPADKGSGLVEREYQVLHFLEFNSTRKRMSTIVRFPGGRLQIMCKGADSVIYDRLGPKGRAFAPKTHEHLEAYGEGGLRTLALSYRDISEGEYLEWARTYQVARATVGPEREARLDAAAELIEKDLTLVGATGIEDKLQKGVPETIDRLAKAGLKIWVLTGDKVETAINIGYASSLLRQGMTQILITLDNPEIRAAEDSFDKIRIVELSMASVTTQLENGQRQVIQNTDPDAVFALIIDGKSLSYALEEELRGIFLSLAINCASVICCRVSPRQKAQVTELVKTGTGQVTLGVGDGANDVGMIQAADIGVGISGVEGMQAVMASDFSVGQFRFLEKLLLVHGHWCYKRIAFMICYFFYKNITFGLTLFYFNGFALFSGQGLFNDWYLSLFNVFFTSLPVIFVGVLDQDVSSKACIHFPVLYRQGPQNVFFSWRRILSWQANGVYASIINFVFVLGSFGAASFRANGKVAESNGIGTALYTTIIWTVNLQIAASVNYWTWVQHVTIWGTILFWYFFTWIYGLLSATISTNAYKVFVEVIAPSGKYWLLTLLVPIVSLLPYFACYAFQRLTRPMDHQIVQEVEVLYAKQMKDPLWIEEKTKMSHPTNFGFSAAVEAKVKRLQKKWAKRAEKRRAKKAAEANARA